MSQGARRAIKLELSTSHARVCPSIGWFRVLGLKPWPALIFFSILGTSGHSISQGLRLQRALLAPAGQHLPACRGGGGKWGNLPFSLKVWGGLGGPGRVGSEERRGVCSKLGLGVGG